MFETKRAKAAYTVKRSRSDWLALGRDGLRDTIAGVVASVVLIGNVVSFGALMFPGEFSAGIPIAVWSMLIGGCICGVLIALATSLPPLATGIDSPTGTVLVLLSALAGAHVVSAGGSPQSAIQVVMLLFSTATLLLGALFYLLGACRWGSYFRFVPFSVAGGFLAATGCFLIIGGVRMVTARVLSFHALMSPWTLNDAAKFGTAVVAVTVLLTLRLWIKWSLALPTALLVMWLGLVATLHSLGLSDAEHAWYFRSLGTLTAWSPFAALHTSSLSWLTLEHLIPELFAVLVVALISLITKVSSIEISRQTSADLDRELRAHGIASLIAAPLGGITCGVQVGSTRLLEHAGAATRMSGVAAALMMGIVGVAHFDLPGLIPIPLVGALVFYLGYSFIADALWRPLSQRAWLDLALIVGITIACLQYGYLVGVLAGLVCACMLFVISYARLGVIRRHATRAQLVSNVDRSSDASEYLLKSGDTIHVYWLSGYVFFGSSEGVFGRVKTDIDVLDPRRVSYVILDFSLVAGADTSAIGSLVKLRRFCREKGAFLICCSLSAANRAAFERGGFLDRKNLQQVHSDLNSALGWCEDQVLANARLDADVAPGEFEPWLSRQLGKDVRTSEVLAYLECKNIADAHAIYHQGDPADTLDLVAAGQLKIEVTSVDGQRLVVRRVMAHTVIGEMGFFREAVRSASVASDGSAILFTLTRANFDRMRSERPDLANALATFIVRVMADRIESANREIAALIR